jgi:hypothetical protein
MSMLYARYGRIKMEAKLKELFGAGLEETGARQKICLSTSTNANARLRCASFAGKEGGEINFAQYSRAVTRTQLQTFYESTQGRLAASKSGGLRLLDTTDSGRK